MKNRRHFLYALLMLSLLNVFAGKLWAQDQGDGSAQGLLSLDQALMCESIEAFNPRNTAVVFSINVGKVLCYTFFSHVPKETVIYHSWYRKDQLSSKRKLTLKPPKWSTFSGIQLREADKGPWRVEISDEDDNILEILRFSITE